MREGENRQIIDVDQLIMAIRWHEREIACYETCGVQIPPERAREILENIICFAISKARKNSTQGESPNTQGEVTQCTGNCQSSGERLVARVLKEMGYTPYHNVIKRDCIGDHRPLPFDFGVLVNGKELLIEYDGEQHEEAIPFFGGDEKWEKVKRYDRIKTNYCEREGIPLLRINKKRDVRRELIGFISKYEKTSKRKGGK